MCSQAHLGDEDWKIRGRCLSRDPPDFESGCIDQMLTPRTQPEVEKMVVYLQSTIHPALGLLCPFLKRVLRVANVRPNYLMKLSFIDSVLNLCSIISFLLLICSKPPSVCFHRQSCCSYHRWTIVLYYSINLKTKYKWRNVTICSVFIKFYLLCSSYSNCLPK